MDDLCLRQASLPRSRPLRTYPYNRIRRSVMETCAAAPIISCLTDQSLFRCLYASREMSAAAASELPVWPQLFSVRPQIHLSGCGFGRPDEPLVLPCDGCCACDLYSASAEDGYAEAPSVTQICSRFYTGKCRHTAGCDRRTLPGRPGRGGGSPSTGAAAIFTAAPV